MDLLVGIVLAFIGLSALSIYIGTRLIKYADKLKRPSPIPVARLDNLEGTDKLVEKGHRAGRKFERAVLRIFGWGLIAAPAVAIYEVYEGLTHLNIGGGSKGRVLRINSRAQLAEPARGDGWSGEAVTLEAIPAGASRTVIGELWLTTARMEHASVAAFSQLALHLSTLGAPAHLLEATHKAALEEVKHTRACFAIVAAITGEQHTAGPIPALIGEPIDLVRLAVGSLVDGCLAEGLAADVAACGAQRASEPVIRSTLAMIAREELGHAELAWSVLAWCIENGGDSVRTPLADRIAKLDREVVPRMPDLENVDPALLTRFGVIDQDTLGELALARIAAVRDRANAAIATRLAA